MFSCLLKLLKLSHDKKISIASEIGIQENIELSDYRLVGILSSEILLLVSRHLFTRFI